MGQEKDRKERRNKQRKMEGQADTQHTRREREVDTQRDRGCRRESGREEGRHTLFGSKQQADVRHTVGVQSREKAVCTPLMVEGFSGVNVTKVQS